MVVKATRVRMAPPVRRLRNYTPASVHLDTPVGHVVTRGIQWGGSRADEGGSPLFLANFGLFFMSKIVE